MGMCALFWIQFCVCLNMCLLRKFKFCYATWPPKILFKYYISNVDLKIFFQDFITFKQSQKIEGNFKNGLSVLFSATKLQNLFEWFLLHCVLGDFIYLQEKFGEFLSPGTPSFRISNLNRLFFSSPEPTRQPPLLLPPALLGATRVATAAGQPHATHQRSSLRVCPYPRRVRLSPLHSRYPRPTCPFPSKP